MEEQVKKFSPSDYDGYKNLVNLLKKYLIKVSQTYRQPFNNLGFMMKQIPSLLKLKVIGRLQFSFKPVSNEN